MGSTLPSAFRSTQRGSFRRSWSSSRKRINRPTSMSFMSCKALESSLGGFSSANGVKSNNERRWRFQMFSISRPFARAALEATLNGLASGVYLTDRQGRIVYMNRAAEHQVVPAMQSALQIIILLPSTAWRNLPSPRPLTWQSGDEGDQLTSGVTDRSRRGRQCRSNRHHPPARARRKPKHPQGTSREWWQSSCKTQS